jgi:hypothetical protein
MVVTVTRAGTGSVYRFASIALADVHPLVQYGDPIITSPELLTQCLSMSECAAVADKIGDSNLAVRIRECPTDLRHRVAGLMGDLWAALERSAPSPPRDPAVIVREIVRDRVATRAVGVHLRPRGEHEVAKKHHEDTAVLEPTPIEAAAEVDVVAEAAAEAEAAASAAEGEKPKHRPIPKEAKFSETSIITMGADVDGKKYGADHNPKKAGSASADRFARYVDGMTVKAALDAGLLRGDLSNDADKKYISIV